MRTTRKGLGGPGRRRSIPPIRSRTRMSTGFSGETARSAGWRLMGLLISRAPGVSDGSRASSAPLRTLPNASSARSRFISSCAKSIIAPRICSASWMQSLTRPLPKIQTISSERFSDRIQALSANQDLLVRNEWNGVEVEDLARAQLAPFAGLIGSRIAVHGPKLRLKAASAQAIGLALHELATNAGKYGALSTDTGRVDISWGSV